MQRFISSVIGIASVPFRVRFEQDSKRLTSLRAGKLEERMHNGSVNDGGALLGSSAGCRLQERKATDGQSILIGFALGNQAFQVSFKLWKLPLEIICHPHEGAGIFDALDRLLENVDFRVHGSSLDPVERTRANFVPEYQRRKRCHTRYSKMTPS
jgi:hypothetical protein